MQFFPEVRHKKLVVVGDDFERETILAVPFLEKKFCQAARCKGAGGWDDADVQTKSVRDS